MQLCNVQVWRAIESYFSRCLYSSDETDGGMDAPLTSATFCGIINVAVILQGGGCG